jgi:hypothetical protein
MDKVFRVPFRISGYVEVEARNADDAWEKAHELSLRDLVDEPSVTVDLELPECQE